MGDKMPNSASPLASVVRVQNCQQGDPVDGPGLVHHWVLVDEGDGDTYTCRRCGQKDFD